MSFASRKKGIESRLKAGGLREFLAPSGRVELPWSSWFFVVGWVAIVSAGIAARRIGDASPGEGAPPVEAFLPVALLVLAWVLGMVLSMTTRTREERCERALKKKGVVVPAAVVMANGNWQDVHPDEREGSCRGQWWQGVVVYGFDPEVEERVLEEAGRALFDLKTSDRTALDPERLVLAWTLWQEQAGHQGLRVPDGFVSGLRDAWMASVPLPHDPLRHGDCVVALAVPNDPTPGSVVVLPAEAGAGA